MRVLTDEAGGRDLISAARREAAAAFGDGTLYVERLIEKPRHVEIQVFCDNHGNVVHLFERECSIQRRHQKVVEESPSPALSPARAGRPWGRPPWQPHARQGIATPERLSSCSKARATARRFYFLEMNTRLQVEHPVTEAVTGVDLVRAQLTVAAGGVLPWSQGALSQRGHAIEVRVYAEDPANGFVPQAGPLLVYREPRGPGIRVDSGVREGGTVRSTTTRCSRNSPSWPRREARRSRRTIAALHAFPVLGIRTNIPFLGRVLDHPDFRAGHLHTGFIEQHLDRSSRGSRCPGTRPSPPPQRSAARCASAGRCCVQHGRPVGNAHTVGTLNRG